MKRGQFIARVAGGAFAISAADAMTDEGPFATTEVEIERVLTGKPHAGKVLAAIQPHADDLPIFACGLVLKLINEGYTGYLIRTTNDDHTGPGTVGEGVLANERDNFAVTKACGLKKSYDLYYRNHMLDAVSPLELRLRLIFLFRLLKVDTVICYDPWAHYEENPDHYCTASAVEAACWMAGRAHDYPDNGTAGLAPHAVSKLYYLAWPQSAWTAYETAIQKLTSTVDGVERHASPWPDWTITTVIDTRAVWTTVWRAASCHESQLAAYERLAALPPAQLEAIWGRQFFYRAFRCVNGGRSRESDLFEGIDQ